MLFNINRLREKWRGKDPKPFRMGPKGGNDLHDGGGTWDERGIKIGKSPRPPRIMRRRVI